MYLPGDAVDVVLRDLPHMPGWTIPANALIIAVDGDDLLLYTHDHDLNGAGMYATGTLSSGLHGPAIEQPITDGPQPGRITLGRVTDHLAPPNHLADRARAALAIHIAARASTPLDAKQLPVLDLACTTLAERRAAADAAEDDRDQIVRRLLVGDVAPGRIARPGLSTSRISQIKNASLTAA